MKGKNYLMLALLLTGSSIPLLADNVTKLHWSEMASLQRPLLTDTVNVKGEKISVEKLMLAYSLSLDEKGSINKDLSADTTGYFKFGEQGKGYRMYVLTTRLRSDRFTHVRLKISSPQRIQVLVNGEKKGEKTTVEDSLSKSKDVSVNLRLEPEVLYKIAFKVLSAPEDKLTPALKIECLPDEKVKATVACDPMLKTRALVPALSCNNAVSNVLVSPNGKYVLTFVNENYSEGKSNSYVTLSDTHTHKVLATYPMRDLRWLPRSSRMWYATKGPKGTCIRVIDPETLSESILSDKVPEGRFTICPDECHLLTSQYEAIEGDKGPLHRVLSMRDRSGAERGRWFISYVDIRNGLSQRLTYGLRTSSVQDVSRDGRYLLFSQSEDVPTKWPFSSTSFYRMNLETYEIDSLVCNEMFASTAKFSPDGRSIVFIGGPEAFGGVGKNCGSHPIANDYDKQAFLFDIETRKILPISRTFDPSLDFLCWNQSDGCIYFKADDKDRISIYRYSLKKNSFEKLPLKGDCITRFSLGSQSSTAAYITLTTESPAVGYLYDTRSGRNALLADPNASNRSDMEFGEVRDWNFESSDGTTITGYYCLPPHFDSSRKYPLIVYYYGGTTPSIRTMHSPYSPQILASRDYVVYILNPSGTIGFGQEFSARHVNAWGKYTADEIIEGTKKFCAEHASFIDSTRVGCMGASYGGFMTEYLQTKTKLFRAAVSHAGISNVTSYWGEGYWGVGYNAVAAAQSYPWQNPELFTQQGALFNADKITTPLLLLHGTVDTNVPIGESIQLYNALKILGRPVEFVQVDGENHIITDVTKRQLWQNTIMAWFARWLQDAPEWWNDLYPEKRLK